MTEGPDKANPKLFILTLLGIALVAGFFWLSLQHFPSVGGKIFFTLLGCFFFMLGLIGLKTGSVPSRWCPVEKATQPVYFWMVVVVQFLAGAAVIAFGWMGL